MDALNWELAILSRAVAYQNLSGAAQHVGLSQPQLSRIVSSLEQRYDVILLDRTAKRKSGWTPQAFKLAQIYGKLFRQFNVEILHLSEGALPRELSIGSLEGLVPSAIELPQKLFAQTKIRTVELHVYDLNSLEELFLKGELDCIYTSREPGRKKFQFQSTIGYQSLDHYASGSETQVLSAFQFEELSGAKKLKTDHPILVSNSLAVRALWLERYGGAGTLPSKVTMQAGKDKQPVLVVAQDRMPRKLWELLGY